MNDGPSTDAEGSAERSHQRERSWWQRLTRRLAHSTDSREDLLALVDAAQADNLVEADAADMIRGVLETRELQVRDIMVPRAQMVIIERDWTPDQVIQAVIESGHSRYPVIGDSRDEVVGILLAKDLLKIAAGPQVELPKLLRPPVFVPESKRVNVLLKDFRKGRTHMAIVADEYGGVAGLVTIEDVLETIVGDIDDEYDESETAHILKQDERHYLVMGLTPIDEFNERFGAEFSDEEFDTIGGLVMHAFGHMPRRGESVAIERFQFNVQRADSRRILQLQVALAQS